MSSHVQFMFTIARVSRDEYVEMLVMAGIIPVEWEVPDFAAAHERGSLSAPYM